MLPKVLKMLMKVSSIGQYWGDNDMSLELDEHIFFFQRSIWLLTVILEGGSIYTLLHLWFCNNFAAQFLPEWVALNYSGVLCVYVWWVGSILECSWCVCFQIDCLKEVDFQGGAKLHISLVKDMMLVWINWESLVENSILYILLHHKVKFMIKFSFCMNFKLPYL